MIVVVEGPSASGKTTWANASGAAVVPEHSGADSTLTTNTKAPLFWAEINVQRWTQAMATEGMHGLVVCDSDPLKLHYDFCLLRLARLSMRDMHTRVELYRSLLAQRVLGMADLVLCEFPDGEVLIRRREADQTRARRNFATHLDFAGPLQDWYGALDAVDPGRVLWCFPPQLPEAGLRDRYSLDLFDAWMQELGVY